MPTKAKNKIINLSILTAQLFQNYFKNYPNTVTTYHSCKKNHLTTCKPSTMLHHLLFSHKIQSAQFQLI